MIDFNNSNRAIYLQIADDICDKILMGSIVPDERIPSVREYAVSVEVNVNTVVKAYDYLSGLGIIYNKRGLGFFASADARELVAGLRRRELIDEGLKSIFRQLSLLDITPETLADMYTKYLNEQKDTNK